MSSNKSSGEISSILDLDHHTIVFLSSPNLWLEIKPFSGVREIFSAANISHGNQFRQEALGYNHSSNFTKNYMTTIKLLSADNLLFRV